ncbi:hypothetical protein TNCT_534681 [Trichonephila clavata]|uniref:Uncharacterized protein n=1 Tax=Trichonephila clavata TaxID=2740835 RepID=A0A8X6FYD0_TRICU|nr:hypothetical protein TNCT_534681 [Trichonephila clavata]
MREPVYGSEMSLEGGIGGIPLLGAERVFAVHYGALYLMWNGKSVPEGLTVNDDSRRAYGDALHLESHDLRVLMCHRSVLRIPWPLFLWQRDTVHLKHVVYHTFPRRGRAAALVTCLCV